MNVITLAAVAALALPAQDEGNSRPIRIAVYNLDGSGVEDRVLRVAEASLLAEVRKLQRCSAISMDEVRTLLDFEAEKQMVGCEEDSCLAEIAEALGADALIVGGAARVGDQVTVSLKRVALDTAAVTQTFTKQLAHRNGEEVLAIVGPAVEALFPELPLKPGQTRGVDEAIAVYLNPPPLPAWAFWSGVGVSGALAAVTGITGALWLSSDATLQSTFEDAKTTPVPAAQVQRLQESVTSTNAAFWILAGVTTTSVVGTLFALPFTDFDDAGSQL
jgi:hypothetical protein